VPPEGRILFLVNYDFYVSCYIATIELLLRRTLVHSNSIQHYSTVTIDENSFAVRTLMIRVVAVEQSPSLRSG
jgi:hypothetical protein